MPETLFHDGWTVQRSEGEPEEVTLPHDAMIGEQRVPGGGSDRHGAFFPGGRYRYSKHWTAPADVEHRRISLFFEGVYGAASVRVDGAEVGANASGYREFEVVLSGALQAGRKHLIEVDVDNTSVPNSRWYTGSGIYRPVWLRNLPRHHLDRAGLVIRTASLGSSAILEVAAPVRGDHVDGLQVTVTLADAGQVAAETASSVAAGEARLLLDVPRPRLWSSASPQLYTVTVALTDASGTVLDRIEQRIGIRTLEVDSRRGLRVNGQTVLLQGACVHHDNGILGAATFAAAEHRRARILKQNGFNAVRSSHNPLSRAFLDACDELGLYVIDETTDYWRQRKSLHDLSSRFDELWQGDLRSMIEKDRNRPSVIMYAIGNEIPDTATPAGVETARELSRFSAALDPTRPTTLAVNMMVNLMASRGRDLFENTAGGADAAEEKADASTAANVMADKLGSVMNLVSRLPAADKASKEAFAAVDVAGYNYAFGRYAGDRKRYPDRVILGTESMAGDLPKIWRQVERIPGVIGDFMWTGWDYLGEVGIGTWTYGDDKPGLAKQYPHLV
ncbi:MAG TPA: glycoside hydrolase family 2 TIM barrel-domain containing protein, partial [Naasia sp.]